ncbi:MAG: hypothetical protein DME25_19820 [Verrucomicrobia bacterium]|nr:MAG: hypothetical protein DME25_19820 [Verrucomicrobiota bacterium]
MKHLVLCPALLAASLWPAFAQVTAEVILDQDQFLAGEALPAAVRIANRSGQTLRLGGEEDWLSFSVESRENAVVSKIGEVPVRGEFALESSQTATKHVDLAPYFALGQPGRYAIVATLRIKGWDRDIVTAPKSFYIIQGAKLWEREVGVPQTARATNAPPEVRKYILQQANYLKSELRLYLRVTDAGGAKVFRAVPIGTLLNFSRPEAQVDKFSNLHVIYQSGPQSFSYSVFNPDGELLTRQTHDYIGTRPRLKPDAEGNVLVAGGVRRVTANDRPVPKSETPAESAPVSKP